MNDFVNPFRRAKIEGFPERAAAIKLWTRRCMALSDETVVSVNELACGQPGCPPRQTVILILHAQQATRKLAIHKALHDVTDEDIESACKKP